MNEFNEKENHLIEAYRSLRDVQKTLAFEFIGVTDEYKNYPLNDDMNVSDILLHIVTSINAIPKKYHIDNEITDKSKELVFSKRFLSDKITNLEGGRVTDRGDNFIDEWALLYNGIVVPFEDGTVKRFYIQHSVSGETFIIDDGE